ncbi:hypothetical protein Tco_0397638 [Tanacetum coccineum]
MSRVTTHPSSASFEIPIAQLLPHPDSSTKSTESEFLSDLCAAPLSTLSPVDSVPSSTPVIGSLAPTRAELLPPCKRFRDSYSSKAIIEEDTEIDPIETEVDMELGIGDGDDVRDHVKIDPRDVRDTHAMSKVHIDRIVEIKTVQRRLEADQLMARRQRVSMIKRIDSLRLENLKVHAMSGYRRIRTAFFFTCVFHMTSFVSQEQKPWEQSKSFLMQEAKQIVQEEVTANPVLTLSRVTVKENKDELKKKRLEDVPTLTVKNRYPLPRSDNLFDQLQGSSVYSKFDLRSGYHQLRVRDKDILKTAFSTSKLTKRVPSDAFWVDLRTSSVHGLDEPSLHVDPAKIESIKDWESPKTPTEIRQFLGLAGYYRRFIKGFSKIAKPVTKLTQKSYHPGKANVVADALSRKSRPKPLRVRALQAEQELFETVKAFHACKQEEGQSVSTYVLKMKAYLDQMERLGYPMPLVLGVNMILTSLSKDYDQFVQNYNMHGMRKTILPHPVNSRSIF